MPLARCTEDDIPQICAIEAREENHGRIGAWSPEAHRAHMARPHVAYFARRVDGALAAYAIVDRIVDPDGWVYLRRIAANVRGAGHGRALLIDILHHLFAETEARSVELRVRGMNINAHRLYRQLGFREDGVLHTREGYDVIVMTIRREEWLATV